MIRVSNIKVAADKKPTEELLKSIIEKRLKTRVNKIKIFKKSIDARDKQSVHYLFTIDAEVKNESRLLHYKDVSRAEEYKYIQPRLEGEYKKPVVVGFGPAGMFAALILARAGAKPIVLERGSRVEERIKAVEALNSEGKLDIHTNIQFGEGGAGTFSDGKLTTNIKDSRCRFVTEELIKAGVAPEIAYLAKPHIGTDVLREVVKKIRWEIIALGGEIRFDTQMVGLETENNTLKGVLCLHNEKQEALPCEKLILAIGHSARDTFEMLKNSSLEMEQKAFSMGVRIEHRQEKINRAQYGDFAEFLPPADYKLATHLENGRGVYTFCMCPGGVVVCGSSEEGGVATNGMSYYDRAGENANSALLVGITPEDFGSDDALAGVQLQRKLERAAYKAGGGDYSAPVQLVGDFLKSMPTKKLGNVKPSYKPRVKCADFKDIFPSFMYEALQRGIVEFDKHLSGFADSEAVMTAVESRSSSPVRILRSKSLESTRISGIYPCGEGCGYAGGIMSAAVDGIKCAEAVVKKMTNFDGDFKE